MRYPPDPRWYAVHTRAHHERRVAEELAARGFETFFPEYPAWSRRRDRRARVLRPLFPGYLFVRARLDAQRHLDIRKTRSVVRLLGRGRQPLPVPDHQVESIRLLLGRAGDAGPRRELRPGQLVQVMEGPLAGVVGVVERCQGRARIVVNVDLLGRSVAATLGTESLTPFFDPPAEEIPGR